MLQLLQQFRRFIEELLRQSLTAPFRRVMLGLRFFTQVGIGFYQDRCFLMASTLAFSSAFALVPISTFFFSIFAAFPKFKELIEQARLFVIAQTLPESAMRNEVITYLNDLASRSMDITAISIVSLVFSSVMLFVSIEDSLNTVFVVRHPPPIQRTLMTYTNLLFWGPLFMALSVYLWLTSSERFQALTSMFLSQPGHFFLTLLTSWVMFAGAYWLLPYGNTSLNSSILGGLIGATLWEAAKKAFGFYLLNAFTYSKIYGAVGFIPVTLLWIYTSCLIFLFGAKVSFCYQFKDMLELLGHEQESDPVLISRATLASLLVIGRRFRAGEPPPSIYDLSRAIKAPSYLVQKGLMALETNRILHSVTRRRDTFLPARGLETITLKEVFWATFSETPELRGSRPEIRFADHIVHQAQDAIGAVLRDQTIATVLDDERLWQELTGASPASPREVTP